MTKKKAMWMNICWIAVFLIACGSIAYGWFGREEWETVLTKAINICFQCIGLG